MPCQTKGEKRPQVYADAEDAEEQDAAEAEAATTHDRKRRSLSADKEEGEEETDKASPKPSSGRRSGRAGKTKSAKTKSAKEPLTPRGLAENVRWLQPTTGSSQPAPPLTLCPYLCPKLTASAPQRPQQIDSSIAWPMALK